MLPYENESILLVFLVKAKLQKIKWITFLLIYARLLKFELKTLLKFELKNPLE